MNPNNKLYERFLNLSLAEQRVLKSAAADSNLQNSIPLVKMHLGDAPGPDIIAFLNHLKQSA